MLFDVSHLIDLPVLLSPVVHALDWATTTLFDAVRRSLAWLVG